MVSVNRNVYTESYNKFFGLENSQSDSVLYFPPKKTLTDEFIDAVKVQTDRDLNGKKSGGFTAAIPKLLTAIYSGVKIAQVFSGEKYKTARISMRFMKAGKNLIPLFLGCFISNYLNKYFNSKTDENYNKLKTRFDEINTDTNAKLADKMIVSPLYFAYTNAISGKIQFSKNMINDPIMSMNLDKIIRHELVHAKQYETIARSKDGIKKLNFAALYNIKKSIERNKAKEGFDEIYTDLMNNLDRYKDTRIELNGGSAEVNLKDYVVALHTLLNNPDATYDDIPIVIDAQHYQEVIDKKGPLSNEEETKADKYYKAMLDYPELNFMSGINPWSSYRRNLLEKEAYQQYPGLITKLSYMFE